MNAAIKVCVAALLVAVCAAQVSGCASVKKSAEIVKSDPVHAPENLAYLSQRLLEKVVENASEAVLNTGTPREVADALKAALPFTIPISDALVAARYDYVHKKADLEAMRAIGESVGNQPKLVADALAVMQQKTADADNQRMTLVKDHGKYVSRGLDEIEREFWTGAAEPLAAMPFPFLLMIPALTTLLGDLATKLAGKKGGGATAAHYFGLVGGLVSQGLETGVDVSADLKEVQDEMQKLVDEDRAATDDEMAASNQRLKDAVARAVAHDTSGHPSIKPEG